MIELSDSQHAQLHARLKVIRTELQETLRVTAEHAGTVHLDQTAVGRLSRVDALQAQQMAAEQRRRSELRLRSVHNALRRVEDEVYGDCMSCGEPMEFARLTAQPEAPLCMSCSERRGW
ncbi:MAG: DnaK suppressor protein [Myxococcota bacterium]